MTAAASARPASDTTSRRASADRYYEQGCRLVEQATRYWNQANDPGLDDMQRSSARLAYEEISARARSCFKRHDVILDAVARSAPEETP